MRKIILLGPQRLKPTVAETARSIGIDGPFATVTAGWEERELEDDELRSHLGVRTINLQLWERAEKVFEKDPELHLGLRRRKDRLAELQRMYRLRLNSAMEAAMELLAMEGATDLLEPEQDAALEAVRQLDEHHLERVREVRAEFNGELRPFERDAVVEHRVEIARLIEEADALAIAGGDVAVLLTRLELFDVVPLTGIRPIISWSAGAMALGEKVVLFHDSPPQGRGHAEVYAPGLRAYEGLLPLPHARRRLLLNDRGRVSLLRRRFEPLLCVPMDEGERVEWTGQDWRMAKGTRQLSRDGGLTVVGQS